VVLRDPGTESHRRSAIKGLDQSSVMGVELLAATLTWAGIGWLLDRRFGTAPWLLAIGALLGNMAGIYLIWLRGRRMDAIEEARAARIAAEGQAREDQTREDRGRGGAHRER
jgi:F0F1-type ATP synthase assembly protein I